MLKRKLDRLEAILRKRQNAPHPVLARLGANPAELMGAAGMAADPWQVRVLRSDAARLLLLCSRQAGKSTVAGALALHTALVKQKSLILLLSPSMRQSGELFRKVVELFNRLGRPVGVARESAVRLELANGSRVISLPGDERNIRGFSGVSLLVVDEAARVADSLYYSIRPMLAVSGGRLVALTTPCGKRGWFYQTWASSEDWERVRITADQCPRISRAFLEEERAALGERWFNQEYQVDFADAVGCVFTEEEIQNMFSDKVQPLFISVDE
jgi:hypothetical protein